MEEIRGNKVSFDPNKIVLTAGATSANETLIFCLAEAGDAILIPTPYYPGYVSIYRVLLSICVGIYIILALLSFRPGHAINEYRYVWKICNIEFTTSQMIISFLYSCQFRTITSCSFFTNRPSCATRHVVFELFFEANNDRTCTSIFWQQAFFFFFLGSSLAWAAILLQDKSMSSSIFDLICCYNVKLVIAYA